MTTYGEVAAIDDGIAVHGPVGLPRRARGQTSRSTRGSTAFREGAPDALAGMSRAPARHGRWGRWALVVALMPLLVGAQIQRGLAEAHHNFDAPLTIEAPWQLLPCDLALGSCPAVLDHPLQASLAAAVRAAASSLGLPSPAAERLRAYPGFTPDTSRAPPAR